MQGDTIGVGGGVANREPGSYILDTYMDRGWAVWGLGFGNPPDLTLL